MKHKHLIIAIVTLGLMIVAVLDWQYWPTLKTVMPIKKHGVYGKITLEGGDCMPSTTSKYCRRSPVSRTIYFYRPALSVEAMTGTHYTGQITAKATTKSDWAGKYQIDLPEGQYSVLVEDTGGPYCNGSPDGIACNITVTSTPQERNVTIDHATH